MRDIELLVCRFVIELGKKIGAKKVTVDTWRLHDCPPRVGGCVEGQEFQKDFIIFFRVTHGLIRPFLAIINQDGHTKSYFIDKKDKWTN